MPEMIASQRSDWSAAMMPSKPILVNSAVRPIRSATSLPMSISAPTASEPSRNSIGGKARSEQNTSGSSWALTAGATVIVAAQLMAMTPTVSRTRMLSQFPNLDLDFRLTMHAPHGRRLRRGPACPPQVHSPFAVISNARHRWRLLVAGFSQRGQRSLVQTSCLTIGRIDGGANPRLRISQVFLQRRYCLWLPLAEERQERAVLLQVVVQIVIRPVGHRQDEAKLH